MINAALKTEAQELQESLREAHEELRHIPGGIGHLVDLQLEAAHMIGLLLDPETHE